jgi:hypothetical protein
MLQAIQNKNGHFVRLQNIKKEVRRPRHIRQENFENGVGERACKKVDSMMCLA